MKNMENLDHKIWIENAIIRNELNNLSLSYPKRNTPMGKKYDYRNNAKNSIRNIRTHKKILRKLIEEKEKEIAYQNSHKHKCTCGCGSPIYGKCYGEHTFSEAT